MNGTAKLSTDKLLCASFAMEGKSPKCVIMVRVERAYTQCKKALVRSNLWHSNAVDTALPSVGTMMQNLDEGFNGKAYDSEYPERMARTLC